MDTQHALVTKVTEDSVVLSIQDKLLTWPKDSLGDVKEGDKVYITVMADDDAQVHQEKVAKALLNSVLNPKS